MADKGYFLIKRLKVRPLVPALEYVEKYGQGLSPRGLKNQRIENRCFLHDFIWFFEKGKRFR